MALPLAVLSLHVSTGDEGYIRETAGVGEGHGDTLSIACFNAAMETVGLRERWQCR
jgi:hypothetical protein